MKDVISNGGLRPRRFVWGIRSQPKHTAERLASASRKALRQSSSWWLPSPSCIPFACCPLTPMYRCTTAAGGGGGGGGGEAAPFLFLVSCSIDFFEAPPTCQPVPSGLPAPTCVLIRGSCCRHSLSLTPGLLALRQYLHGVAGHTCHMRLRT